MIARTYESPLFDSPHAAMLFAHNFSGGQFAAGALGKLQGTPRIGSGKGLIGLDGAGQAGMILGVLRDAERGCGLGCAMFMAARFAPHTEPCACGSACCAGMKRSRTWDEATRWIADMAIAPLSGRSSNRRLRLGIVRRYYGEWINLSDLADRSGVARNTASDHNSLVTIWLRREESRLRHAAEEALRDGGIC